MEEKFKLGKKWFWIGIVISGINPLAGLVYGIALILEKSYRKVGLVLLLITIVFAIIAGFSFQFLLKKGIIHAVRYEPTPVSSGLREGMPLPSGLE